MNSGTRVSGCARSAGLAAVVITLLSGSAPVAGQATTVCAGCEDGAALIRRLNLREGGEPMRDRPGWSPPRRIVTFGGEDMAAALRAAVPGVEVIGADDPAAALAAVTGADIWIGPCAPDIIRAGTSLRWIQLPMAGAEMCTNQPLIGERGIVITNMQALFAPQIADHVMAMILSFARHLHVYRDEQRRGAWSHLPADRGAIMRSGVWELDGKVLLVVGLGGVGTEIARRAHALGMTVLATRNSSRDGPDFVEYVGMSNEAAALAARADVVVNAAPLTADTRGMFDADFFRAMKRGAYFINVGRGESVVTDDLVTVLQSGGIAGAGLDVTSPEPLPPGHPLWSMPNVILTPHSAAGSQHVTARAMVLIRENLRRYVRGDRLLSVVDVNRGY